MPNNPTPTQEISPLEAIYDLGATLDGPISEM
jgi:hypothetical protein